MDRPEMHFPADRRAGTQPADVRFIRLKEVLAICGKSRSSVYEAIKKGEFPRPIKLGPLISLDQGRNRAVGSVLHQGEPDRIEGMWNHNVPALQLPMVSGGLPGARPATLTWVYSE